jgi:hypothetical protein
MGHVNLFEGISRYMSDCRNRRDDVGSVRVVDDVIYVESWHYSAEVNIDEIVEVVAYKIDNFTYDTIWLELRTSTNAVHVRENMAGFFDVIATLRNRLCPFNEEWQSQVTLPPFETCLTVLFPFSR